MEAVDAEEEEEGGTEATSGNEVGSAVRGQCGRTLCGGGSSPSHKKKRALTVLADVLLDVYGEPSVQGRSFVRCGVSVGWLSTLQL